MKRHQRRRHTGWTRLRRPQDETETTKQIAEHESQMLSPHQGNSAGIIRPDTGDLHLPSGLEATGEGQQTNAPPLVMLVIITLALMFIAIITYLVGQMPNKN